MTKLDRDNYGRFWSNLHATTSDDLAAVLFPDKPAYFNRFFDRMQRHALRSLKLPLAGRKLLDLGCGRGRWLRFFQACGAQVVGIDLSEQAVRRCQEQGFEAHQGDVTRLMFPTASFDVVSSITVLLHIPPDQKRAAIQEIARVLKPNGLAVLIESTWDDPSPHVFGLRVEDWTALFQEAGLQRHSLSAHYFNWARRWLPERLPARDRLAIALDYPLEWLLMTLFHGRQSTLGLQHVMLFQKCP